MKLLISKSGRFISKHLQNRSNPYEGKVARRMNENTIPERTHGEITRKENAVIPRDYSVYGTPEQARTAGVPLRRRTLYPTEVRGRMEVFFAWREPPYACKTPLGVAQISFIIRLPDGSVNTHLPQ